MSKALLLLATKIQSKRPRTPFLLFWPFIDQKSILGFHDKWVSIWTDDTSITTTSRSRGGGWQQNSFRRMTDLLGQSYIIMAAYKKRKMDRLKGSYHLLIKFMKFFRKFIYYYVKIDEVGVLFRLYLWLSSANNAKSIYHIYLSYQFTFQTHWKFCLVSVFISNQTGTIPSSETRVGIR